MKGRKPKLKGVQAGAISGRCPSPPTWLAPHARAEWKRTAPELHARGLLTPDVLQTLESYCCAAGAAREAEEQMQAEGRTVRTETSFTVHPAFKVAQGAMREARLLAAELGVTPHRRYSAKAEKEEADDDVPAHLLG